MRSSDTLGVSCLHPRTVYSMVIGGQWMRAVAVHADLDPRALADVGALEHIFC